MSDRSEWDTVEPILDAALELPLAERAELLAKECGDDQALRREIEELLAACEQSNGFLETPAAAFAASLVDRDGAEPDDSSPESPIVGPYRLIREIARGGMGRVYLAERADGQFEQRVALKLIKRGMDSDEIHRRFLAERQILARLSHPHIARLLDGGVTSDDQPWFAMEYVDGVPITRHCRERDLGVRDRLLLFEDVCDAVRYAHQNLIVHRDLKPSNILVTSDGAVKLLDFGIAKLLDETSTDQSQVVTGLRAMTPEYAAPEQVRMEPVTTATDVYALGAVLYEMLTGRRVHAFAKPTPYEIERVVCEVDPAAPGISADVDTIILKALRKDPARRYPTADALLEDLRRYRNGLPVRARPDTVGYRTRKFVRRHRLGVAGAAAILLSLVGGLTAAAWQARVAQHEAQRAGEVKNFLVSLFKVSDPARSRGREITARELLDEGAKRLDTALRSQPEIQAELLTEVGKIYHTLGDYAQADSLLRRSVNMSRAIYGESHPIVAERLTNWADPLQLKSHFDRAESLLISALAIRERHFDRSSPEVASTLESLGNVKRLKAEFPQAEAYYKRALTIRRDPRRPNTYMESLDLRALSLVYWEGGKLTSADSAAREALAIQERSLPPDHPEMVRTMYGLAGISRERGNFVDAERLGGELLKKARRVYPRGHPEVATALNELGATLEGAGSYAEAESFYTQAFVMRKELLGDDRPETLNSLSGLAFVRWRMDHLAGAEAAARDALRGYQRLLGDNHRLTLWGFNNLGIILRDQGRYAEAEPLLRRAVTGRRLRLGSNHPTLGISLRHLALLLQRTGRAAEAEPTLREALEVYDHSVPPNHPWRAETLTSLGEVISYRNRPAEAEPLLRAAIAIGIEKFKPSDLRLAESRTVLGATLMKLGRHGEAEVMLRQSYEAIKTHPYGARRREAALRSLVGFYRERGRDHDAAAYSRLLSSR